MHCREEPAAHQEKSITALEAEDRVVAGVRVRVATPATLYRMKSGTVRLQDRADAARLLEHFGFDRS